MEPLNIWEFGIIAVVAGVLCVVGALRRWRWLVDPPTFFWFCDSQSLVKAIAGKEGARVYTLVLGQLFIVFGVVLLLQALFAFVHGP